jgi:murein DD-endopeptidase MepM/ murein hydrolase activator NlpD
MAPATATMRTPDHPAVTSPTVDSEEERPGPLFEVCPVDRPRKYVDDFGDARYSGGYHRHEGIDIFAPYGTPIRAPFAGKAETSTNWAGGLQLYVHGGKGFVFVGHLSEVGKLAHVHAGDVIGYVGTSGNAQGGSPHAHFEWHPDGGPAVNPFRLLNQACRVAAEAAVSSSLRPTRAEQV